MNSLDWANEFIDYINSFIRYLCHTNSSNKWIHLFFSLWIHQTYEFIYIVHFAMWIHLIIICCYMNSFVMSILFWKIAKMYSPGGQAIHNITPSDFTLILSHQILPLLLWLTCFEPTTHLSICTFKMLRQSLNYTGWLLQYTHLSKVTFKILHLELPTFKKLHFAKQPLQNTSPELFGLLKYLT